MITMLVLMWHRRRLNLWVAPNKKAQPRVKKRLVKAGGLCVLAVLLSVWTFLFHGEGQQAFGYYDRGEYSRAIPHLRRLLVLYPGMASINSMLGRSLLEEGQIDSAVQQYRRVVGNGRASAEDHFYLGEALERKGFRAEARAQWQEALSLTEKDSDIAYQARAALDKYH